LDTFSSNGLMLDELQLTLALFLKRTFFTEIYSMDAI